MTWIPRQFHLARYSSQAGNDILGERTGEWTRIQGSPLNGLEVHDLLETEGEQLFWLDEVAQVNVDPILGRLKVRFADLLAMHPQAARRAQLTNADDPEEYLEHRRDKKPAPDPEWVWLGVRNHPQSKWTAADPDLPQWALGVEIVEVEEAHGCFAALGYGQRGGEKYYQFAADYYYELLVEPE
jgi:hypothetical protein